VSRPIPAPVSPGMGDDDELRALRTIVRGTAGSVGDDFLRRLVEHLAAAMHSRHAFVSEFLPPQRIRTLAFWSNGRIVDNLEYDLPGTPCERVIGGGLCEIPEGVQQLYPQTEAGIESYLGVPLLASDGSTLGHLCAFDESPIASDARRISVFEIFAARAAAELDRLRAAQRLRESEQRLLDLFDEAPIAYVHEDLESRFIRANHAALRILGVRPDEVNGMVGMSLVPDTPEAQQRVREAFESINQGRAREGVVLELRRKDNGNPIWIQWWSTPDRGGTYTRTMFIDITDRVLMEREQARLHAQNIYLREEIKAVHNFDEIVGASRALLEVMGQVRRVAPTDATVLVLGESGTGKELIARAIHSSSRRSEKPFIKVNCAALPPGLVESELFGHERGAFSGALQRRIGRFELANGGTIFLDELGDLPPDVQVKLLRVLQEREFERVGNSQPIRCDVRVVAATNRDLTRAVAEGRFRADLFYRLNVFPITLPPLRQRREDIPLLVKFFVQKHGPKIGSRVESIDEATMHRLVQYGWPGNIRELENVIERALILATGSTLTVEHERLPAAAAPPTSELQAPLGLRPLPREPASEAAEPGDAFGEGGDLASVQRDHIVTTLRRTGWVIEGPHGAARRLAMKPATLRHRMRKLGILRASEDG
jgi:formate hydrogenlyase transcriptional activator